MPASLPTAAAPVELTLSECSDRCGGVGPARIKRWIINGLGTRLGRLKLKAKHCGVQVNGRGGWRVLESDLESFLASLNRAKMPRDHDPLTVVSDGDDRFETARERRETKKQLEVLKERLRRDGWMSPVGNQRKKRTSNEHGG